MGKTILIAPFDGPLALALAQASREAGWSAALAVAPRPKGGEAARDEDQLEGAGCVALRYDPASYVSAAGLVAAACNALGDIDAAFIVADPLAGGLDLASCKPGELASLVGARCTGPLFLIRELARRFEARRSGAFVLVAPERPRDAAVGPAASLCEGAFEGLGRGLFAQAESMPWRAFGVTDASGQPDRAARFALSLLEDPRAPKAGRWLRYTGKGGLFGAS